MGNEEREEFERKWVVLFGLQGNKELVMGNCDVCNGYTTWDTGTAYTADEFRAIVRLGFEPPPSITILGPAAVQGWKTGLVANSTTGWLLCPTCARRAARYMPKTSGTGPAGHVLTETMATATLLGLNSVEPAAAKSLATPAPPAMPVKETIRSENKVCPNCKQEIAAEATACPACQASFEVGYKGYCAVERAVMDASAAGTCLKCGQEVLDRAVVSTFLGTGDGDRVDAPAVGMSEPGQEMQMHVVAANAAATGAVMTDIPASAPPVDSKKCPECGETIKLSAKVCRFCNAHFDVTETGYCANCHKLVTPDPDVKCPFCRGELVDRRMNSSLVVASAASTPLNPAAPSLPAAPPPVESIGRPIRWWQIYLSPGGRIGRKTFLVKGILPVLGVDTLIIVVLSLALVPAGSTGSSQPFPDAGMPFFALLVLVTFWAWLMLIAKRFHDLNRSGWNILLWVVPFIGQFIYLINLIECFFVKGKPAPNRFGPATDQANLK